MLGAVQLDHQLMGSNIEVRDIRAKHLLSPYRLRKRLQEIKPQMPLLPGHRMAHLPRVMENDCIGLFCAHILPHLSLRDIFPRWGKNFTGEGSSATLFPTLLLSLSSPSSVASRHLPPLGEELHGGRFVCNSLSDLAAFAVFSLICRFATSSPAGGRTDPRSLPVSGCSPPGIRRSWRRPSGRSGRCAPGPGPAPRPRPGPR